MVEKRLALERLDAVHVVRQPLFVAEVRVVRPRAGQREQQRPRGDRPVVVDVAEVAVDEAERFGEGTFVVDVHGAALPHAGPMNLLRVAPFGVRPRRGRRRLAEVGAVPVGDADLRAQPVCPALHHVFAVGVQLAGDGGVVAECRKPAGVGHRARGQVLHELLDAAGPRALTGRERRTAGHADRARAHGAVEDHAVGRDGVKEGCADDRVPCEAGEVCPVLVGHQEEDVRLRHGGSIACGASRSTRARKSPVRRWTSATPAGSRPTLKKPCWRPS